MILPTLFLLHIVIPFVTFSGHGWPRGGSIIRDGVSRKVRVRPYTLKPTEPVRGFNYVSTIGKMPLFSLQLCIGSELPVLASPMGILIILFCSIALSQVPMAEVCYQRNCTLFRRPYPFLKVRVWSLRKSPL